MSKYWGVVNIGRSLQVKYWGVATPATSAALTPMSPGASPLPRNLSFVTLQRSEETYLSLHKRRVLLTDGYRDDVSDDVTVGGRKQHGVAVDDQT